jgi:putative membrane protein
VRIAKSSNEQVGYERHRTRSGARLSPGPKGARTPPHGGDKKISKTRFGFKGTAKIFSKTAMAMPRRDSRASGRPVSGTSPFKEGYERSNPNRVGIFLEDNVFSTNMTTMKRSLIALGCLLIAGPALAQSVGEKTGVNSPLGISPSTPDFVKQVAISDMFEVESNKLGEQKGNAVEKSFAAQMVKDHTKTSTELKQLVFSGKVKAELPTALDSSHQSKLDKLKSKTGKDFSSDFDSMQADAHKDAVDLFERYAKGGDNVDLKNWAGKTLPALKHHLEMAQALSKSK